MLTLIKNAEIYAPQPLGKQDVVIGGGKILAIGQDFNFSGSTLELLEIDAAGQVLIPGMVDPLAHITGGGGEGGFHTRTPEMYLEEATLAGVTTLVAALGTDATTRTLTDLFAKARGLVHEGLEVYCYTGSYEVPVRTLTGNVRDDIILHDRIIGVGELAIADHRGSFPTAHELARIASEARVGGMLSGKRGIVFLHVGSDDEQLDLISEVINRYPVPLTQFYPTHLNRSVSLLETGFDWARKGMVIDVTASTTPELLAQGELSASECLARTLKAGISAQQISFSSDGNASLPDFNEAGELVGLKVGRVLSMLEALRESVNEHQISWQDAVTAVGFSAAKYLGLVQKGQIAVGMDADIVLLEPQKVAIHSVWCRGQRLVADGKALVRGTFTAAIGA
ncbi:MAG: beta-aspartyl-dipeptidase (metallo-type) IadA [Idiomarinaceae bacterium HL-53]|nr:MAG: beta-aspartyl-dipeptidase (metallo-type) IadA [Idiomarinaceae bacterium HL-53]CUS48389.1 beta-aspartyl-dipeptidase (metallo-type) [Idiomarinaceae bacterium HL-53]